jgi:hypothetical protein
MAGTYAHTDCMPLDEISIDTLLLIKNHVQSEKEFVSLRIRSCIDTAH